MKRNTQISISVFSFIVVLVVALLTHMFDLGRYTHTDEINFWINRSYTFLEAIQNGHFAATAISTHPGVTTMWLGSVGILLRRIVFGSGFQETFPVALTLMRIPVVLTHVACISIGYMLLRRLFSQSIAMLAALLWATDPFVTAFTRILHVDGLMGSFATISLLAACCYWGYPQCDAENPHLQPTWLLVLSAICGALALMSKSPGLAVVPIVGIVSLVYQQKRAATVREQRKPRFSTIAVLLFVPPSLLAWGLIYLLTALLIWPAMWADPIGIYRLLRIGVEVEGGSNHVIANYFLGQLDPAPGPLYYPVVFAIRTTPWSLFGLFLLPFIAKRMNPHMLHTTAMLAGFIVLYTCAMSFFPKKLDRYLEPIFPTGNILAAVGWISVSITPKPFGFSKPKGFKDLPISVWSWGTTGLIATIAIANAAWWHPYGMAYFNPLLGGIHMGIHTVLIGEGEGLGDVAAWLNQQPNITGVVTTSTMVQTLQAFMKKGAQIVSADGTRLNSKTGYVVIYIRHMQRWGNAPPPPYDQFYQRVQPVHVVNIHGVDYAHIYEVPPPISHLVNAAFGQQVQLHGYDVMTTTLRETGTISLTLQWKVQAPITEDYHLFVHMFDSQGQKVGQIDVPPTGSNKPLHTWHPQRYVTWTHPIPVSPNLPAGSYWLALGLYRPNDFTRLPLHAPVLAGTPDDGPDVLFLQPVTIR